MHQDHIIISQNKRKPLQKEQVPSCVPKKSEGATTSKSQAVQEDTLSSSSSSSSEDLPLGLL